MRKLDLFGHNKRVLWGMVILTAPISFLELTGVAQTIVILPCFWALCSITMLLVDEGLPQLSTKYRHLLSIFFIALVLLHLCSYEVERVFTR